MANHVGPLRTGSGAEERAGTGGWSDNPFADNNPSTTVGDPQRPAVAERSSMVSLAIALVYAISDELHQELTPGRGFELADIGYDLAGMVTALGFIWIKGKRKQGNKGKRK